DPSAVEIRECVSRGRAERGSLCVRVRQAKTIDAGSPVLADGGVPRDQLFIVEQIVDVKLHPWTHSACDRDVIGDRGVQEAVTREAFRAAARKENMVAICRRQVWISGGSEDCPLLGCDGLVSRGQTIDAP